MGIPSLKFVSTKKTMQVNIKENLGFCSEYHPNIDFATCAKETPGSEELDLSTCGLKRFDCPNGMKTLVVGHV
jgi:hypothetical protein